LGTVPLRTTGSAFGGGVGLGWARARDADTGGLAADVVCAACRASQTHPSNTGGVCLHLCRQLACGLSEAVVEDAADESEDVAELAADTRTASPKVVKATRKRIVAILQ
jgi:hypothetical protein